MSHDQANDAEVKALRHLIDEAKNASPPAVDWDPVEARLMSRIELEQKARPRKAPRTLSAALSFAVAAAAAAMLLAHLGSAPVETQTRSADTDPVDLAAIPAERNPDELPTYMVAAMKPHSVVEAGDEPVRFSLPGVATWVLDAGSRVVVDSVAVPHVLTLERGTVHAEVVPRTAQNELVESFAVVAGGARVAVHGTVFSVARAGERITVEVTRGAVTVGPASNRGITTGRLLVSPARAAFWIRGGELAEVLDGEAPSAVAMDPSTRAVPFTPGEPSDAQGPSITPLREPRPPTQSAGVEVAPSTDPAQAATLPVLSTGEARDLVMACLRGDTSANDDRVVTISSNVRAMVDASGKIQTVRFSPPLRPDLQEGCGAILFHRRTASGKSISFDVRVAR